MAANEKRRLQPEIILQWLRAVPEWQLKFVVTQPADMAEIDELFAFLAKIGVDGFMLSPAYGYAAVCSTNPDGAAEIFLTRQQIMEKFNAADDLFRKYKMNTSPVYKEFLQGKRDLTCAAWASPTRNVKGWKGPCYLITDAHHESFDDLMNDTEWSNYGYGKDPRCEHCMMHSGYEVAAALGVNRKISDTWKMLKWQLS